MYTFEETFSQAIACSNFFSFDLLSLLYFWFCFSQEIPINIVIWNNIFLVTLEIPFIFHENYKKYSISKHMNALLLISIRNTWLYYESLLIRINEESILQDSLECSS
jgi:hypothetical protein